MYVLYIMNQFRFFGQYKYTNYTIFNWFGTHHPVLLPFFPQVIRAQNEISVQDPILKEMDEDSRVGHLQLKRPVPLASFAIHRPTRTQFGGVGKVGKVPGNA